MKGIILFCILILISSCQKEEIVTSNISEDLKPYVDSFYGEAENRGISLSKNLDALISNEISVCGQGHSPELNGMFDKPTILINEDCWLQISEVRREILVFHELGHAILSRIHIDGILPNGHSKSIMCAGVDFFCSDLPDYSWCPEFREYYVDELFNQNASPPQWSIRNWDVLSNMWSDLNSGFSTDWQVFTNCASNSFQVMIDSISPNRPSNYSLRLFTECDDYLTIRKRIKIINPTSAEAIRLKCDLYHNLVGDGFRMSLFVKNTDNTFTSYNRSAPKEIIESDNTIGNFTIQAECLTADADSLVINFQFLPNTEGEIFIGNIDIQLME